MLKLNYLIISKIDFVLKPFSLLTESSYKFFYKKYSTNSPNTFEYLQ
jgi:hypothetical protein